MTESGDFSLEDIKKWASELRDLQYKRRVGFTYTVTQVQRMLTTEDKRALAPFLMALSMPVGRFRQPVLLAVIRLLFSFEKSDSLDILGPSRWRLFHVLEQHNAYHDHNLLLAVFHALEMSGDTEDLRAMQFLSVRYNTSAGQLVAGAARNCVSAIHGRKGLERNRKVLLRSTDDLHDPQELLRATRVLPYHEPEVLLRNVQEAVKGAEAADT